MLVTVVSTQKLWGENRSIFCGHAVEVHHASIRRGGYSSQHRHRAKANDFYVVSGELEILVYTDKGHVIPLERHVLKAGQKMTTPPNLWHRFNALTDVELIETYWLHTIDPADIDRHDVGGLREDADAKQT